MTVFYCGKWGKLLKAYSEVDLDPMMLNIELVRAFFIYYNVMFLDRFIFSYRAKTHTHTHTHAHKHRETLTSTL